jgi:hypothetical protein
MNIEREPAGGCLYAFLFLAAVSIGWLTIMLLSEQ